jgi:metal-responsive CopG/Arc/MetJ family transcriptional regulator
MAKGARRALVTLPEGVWKVIDQELKGKLGDGDSEVIRHIVVNYLTEKGYLMKQKQEAEADGKEIVTVSIEEIAGQLDVHDSMIESLAELLEEKGHISMEEWDSRIKKKMHKQK